MKKLSEEESALKTALQNQGDYKDAIFIREVTHRYFDELKRLFGDLIDPTKDKRDSWNNYKAFYNDLKDALLAASPALIKAIREITKTEPDKLSLINEAMSRGYHECSSYIHNMQITRPVDEILAKNSLCKVGHLFPKHRDLFGDGIVMLHQLQVLV
jgi:hypothetical protein